MTSTTVELRCPVNSIRMFGKVIAGGHIVEGNLIEFACDDCRKTQRRMGQEVRLVLHRFNVLGNCIETEIVRR